MDEDRFAYADIIVDVKAYDVDRVFLYQIPEQIAAVCFVGSRVLVPFANRKLEGYIVKLHTKKPDDAPAEIKPILEVLDEEPPLTKELVDLSEWMSQRYCTTRSACVQVMVPSGLRTKQIHLVTVREGLGLDELSNDSDRELIIYIQSRQRVTKESLLDRFPTVVSRIRVLLKQGILQEQKHVQNGVSVKQQIVVSLREHAKHELRSILEKIPARAAKQKIVLEYLANHQAVPLQDLLRTLQTSRSTVDRLIEQGFVDQQTILVRRDPYQKRFEQDSPLTLTEEQATVLARLVDPLHSKSYAEFLLQGVTGSGKTEVYLQAMEQCLAGGRQAIVLVPEISLTPQTVDRFKRRFGDAVAVLHSRLSQGERFDEWSRIRQQKVKMVVGARSAIFAPFQNLGLIIIDEEHESSYKQEDSPKYVAHEIARRRAFSHHAVLVYGSATPAFERMQEARDGTIQLVKLSKRVFGQAMPDVHVVDLRAELRNGNRSMFSEKLRSAMETTVAAGNQMILFLNRRGHSTFVLCRSCGEVLKCPHCEISLTLHKTPQWTSLRCHYCGYARTEDANCPTCKSPHIRHFGTGTQRVEEALMQEFPQLRVIRMDIDTTQKKGAHERLLDQFRKKEADVLLGTQMIAKGLDFPDVTLVGVIAADTALNMPDYRAGERTFQLLSQVAGRAGRSTQPGQVIIQTYNPQHYVIQAAALGNYDAFFDYEIDLRKNLQYPPFIEFASWVVTHEHARTAEELVKDLFQELVSRIQVPSVQITSPAPAPFPKLNGKYRYHILMKYRDWWQIHQLVRDVYMQIYTRIKKENGSIVLDVNAQTIL